MVELACVCDLGILIMTGFRPNNRLRLDCRLQPQVGTAYYGLVFGYDKRPTGVIYLFIFIIIISYRYYYRTPIKVSVRVRVT